jgi:hypothetical protein
VATEGQPSFTDNEISVGSIFSACATLGLLHAPCRGVCETQLFYMDENACVSLHFALITQTLPFAVELDPTIFLDMSPEYHQFLLAFPQHARISACFQHVWNFTY